MSEGRAHFPFPLSRQGPRVRVVASAPSTASRTGHQSVMERLQARPWSGLCAPSTSRPKRIEQPCRQPSRAHARRGLCFAASSADAGQQGVPRASSHSIRRALDQDVDEIVQVLASTNAGCAAPSGSQRITLIELAKTPQHACYTRTCFGYAVLSLLVLRPPFDNGVRHRWSRSQARPKSISSVLASSMTCRLLRASPTSAPA